MTKDSDKGPLDKLLEQHSLKKEDFVYPPSPEGIIYRASEEPYRPKVSWHWRSPKSSHKKTALIFEAEEQEPQSK